jgi:hypothetical protein
LADVSHIFRWDLDKTYLATEFDTAMDIWRTFRQTAEEKRNIPGADSLLRALLSDDGNDLRVVTFISGSPQEMRQVLTKKLQMDGIEPEHFVLKPNLKNLLKGRFRAIRGQIGYKLDALLRLRSQAALAPETLFGDDAEADAFVYSLYADVVAGRVGEDVVAKVLKKAKVYDDQVSDILTLVRGCQMGDTVCRIVINLARRSPTGQFGAWGPRLVPVHNYFQASLVLFADAVLSAGDVHAVGVHMNRDHQFSPGMLANSAQDLVRRCGWALPALERLVEELPTLSVSDSVSARMVPGALADVIADRVATHVPAALPEAEHQVPDYARLVEGFVG